MDLHITSHAEPLPELPTAKIDSSSLTVKDGGVLVHYISTNVDFSTATQAIIVIHGKERDAANSFAGMQAAAEAANKSKIIIMAVRSPLLFQNHNLINAHSPFSSMGTIKARFRGRTAQPLPINSCGKVSMSVLYRNGYLTHLREGNEWLEGGINQYPTSISDVSSFDALDAAIAYAADKKRFPMIEHVVLAGHSAGGQSRRLRSVRIQVPDRIF